jgi:hypothetical protein
MTLQKFHPMATVFIKGCSLIERDKLEKVLDVRQAINLDQILN